MDLLIGLGIGLGIGFGLVIIFFLGRYVYKYTDWKEVLKHKKIIGAVIVVFLIIGIAIGSDKVSQPTIGSVGETLTTDGLELTLNDAYRSQGGEFSILDDDKEFILADVTFTNTSDKEVSYNVLNFEIQNAQGQIDGAGFTIADIENMLGSGELAPGGVVNGIVAFEQAKGQQDFKIFYEAFMKDKLTFNVSIK